MTRSLNSVWQWSYAKRYYLTHPWKWFKELFQMIGDTYRRARYGWTWQDVWSMDTWMLTMFPDMLRHMADHGSAYPGTKPFDTAEKWHDWLHSMADILESLQEDNWYSQNEHEERFHELSKFARRVEEKNPYVTVTYDFDEQEMKNVAQLYFQRGKDLTEERQRLIEDTFHELGQHLTKLWD